MCQDGKQVSQLARLDAVVNAQHCFFRVPASNSAVGKPRSWTDDLQWHHAAHEEGREPNSSVAQVLDCYRVLHEVEQQFRG